MYQYNERQRFGPILGNGFLYKHMENFFSLQQIWNLSKKKLPMRKSSHHKAQSFLCWHNHSNIKKNKLLKYLSWFDKVYEDVRKRKIYIMSMSMNRKQLFYWELHICKWRLSVHERLHENYFNVNSTHIRAVVGSLIEFQSKWIKSSNENKRTHRLLEKFVQYQHPWLFS